MFKKASISLSTLVAFSALIASTTAHAQERRGFLGGIFNRRKEQPTVRPAQPVRPSVVAPAPTTPSVPSGGSVSVPVVPSNFGGGSVNISVNQELLAKYPTKDKAGRDIQVFAAPSYGKARVSRPQHDLKGNPYAWKIRRDRWTAQDEVEYGRWLLTIGQLVRAGKCGSFTACLNSPGNPLRKEGEVFDFYTDCADLAYQARAYFSWKKGLPFSIQSSIRMRIDQSVGLVKVLKTSERLNANGQYEVVYVKKKDEATGQEIVTDDPARVIAQTSPNGNYVSGRLDLIMSSPTVGADIRKILGYRKSPAIQDFEYGAMGPISSAFLRTDPRGAAPEVPAESQLIDDTYPIKIGRDSLVPGSVMYDSNGHVALVTEIDKDGNIYTLNAHPGNAKAQNGYMSYKMYSKDHMGPDRTFRGWGWKKFRPAVLMGATEARDENGETILVGGNMVLATNDQIPDYSMEQYWGIPADPTPGAPLNFAINGQTLKYHAYLKWAMAGGSFKVNPISEVTALTNSVCQALKARVTSVDAARLGGKVSDDHADSLPDNIYTTSGDWEDLATASGDFRIRGDASTLTANVANYLAMAADPARRKNLIYDGSDLKADLKAIVKKVADSCSITYTKSDGSAQTLSFVQAVTRIPLFSMDHQHCPELRWGAFYDEGEMRSCATKGAESIEWYKAQQRLRNITVKDNTAMFGQSLAELKAKQGPGEDKVVDTDVFKHLR